MARSCSLALAAWLAQNRPLDGFAGVMPVASPWWRGAVVYQVYVRSFRDGNGDGQGDFAGLLSKLDYIAALGVDAIWLSPIHPSPDRDWGYDVSGYDGVHPDYGTLNDFRNLIEAAHARGLKIVLDEVLAHTSDEHPWFAASRDGDAGKRDWYVWADPKDDGTVPNNWLSVFGGPAWAYQPARRQYYHHKFLRQQPKLNWLNTGAREAALDVLELWLTRGVDGFRLDVANAFLHDAGLKDNPSIPPATRGPAEWVAAANMQRHLNDSNLAENKAVLNVIRRRVEAFDDRFVFGEFSEEFERSGCYLPPDKGLHAGYDFALLLAHDAAAIRAHLETLAKHPDHWPAIAFSNHDVTRTATRFGAGSEKVMLALLFALRGTVLLYQGEELGLPEVDLARDQLRDPVGDLYYPLFKGRDGCRTPMPWDASALNLGFTSGSPWLPLGPAHTALAVAAQEHDPESVLAFTRAMLKARNLYASLRDADLVLLDAPLPMLAFRRGEILCLFNLGRSAMDWAVPEQVTALDFGTGDVQRLKGNLVLGPLSAWFGRI
ncbi:MAG: alpha-amylase family glycosyl hydrolase [Rhizomicrobium sp.]